MIRKAGHIAITALLLILTMGFTVSRHYCGGRLVDVSLSSVFQDSCPESSAPCNMDHCCRNEHQVYQMNEEYTSSAVLDHLPFFQVMLAVYTPDQLIPSSGQQEGINHFSPAESPPPLDKQTILSNLQIFRL